MKIINKMLLLSVCERQERKTEKAERQIQRSRRGGQTTSNGNPAGKQSDRNMCRNLDTFLG